MKGAPAQSVSASVSVSVYSHKITIPVNFIRMQYVICLLMRPVAAYVWRWTGHHRIKYWTVTCLMPSCQLIQCRCVVSWIIWKNFMKPEPKYNNFHSGKCYWICSCKMLRCVMTFECPAFVCTIIRITQSCFSDLYLCIYIRWGHQYIMSYLKTGKSNMMETVWFIIQLFLGHQILYRYFWLF